MWFFIFYRARFVKTFILCVAPFDFSYREDGPKLLVRSPSVSLLVQVLTAHHSGSETSMGGAWAWAP
jgi:hypothetical protein